MTYCEPRASESIDGGTLSDAFADAVPESECWSLLGSTSIGRLSPWAGDVPLIIPVQFHVDGRSIAVCFSQYDQDVRPLNGAMVVFAADAVDFWSNHGWTVQVHGIVRIPDPTEPWRDCGQPAAGTILRIDQATFSGVRFGFCSFMSSLNYLLAMRR